MSYNIFSFEFCKTLFSRAINYPIRYQLSRQCSIVKTSAPDQKESSFGKSIEVRNPRNLEFLGIARKTKGWKFQYPSKEFYHRLLFEQTNRHITGRIEHCSGKTVVSASTKEPAITQFLYGLTDFSAADNIGRVLAQRCRECGITSMIFHCPVGRWTSEKVQVFRKAVIDGGIQLKEPDEIVPPYEPGINYDDPEEVKNLWKRQIQVANIAPLHRIYRRKYTDIPRRRRGLAFPKNWWKDEKLIPEES